MKRKIILSIGLVAFCTFSHSQKLVNLIHNGTSTFFTGNSPVNDAVTAALSGDTVYIPGGGFSIGTLYINKSLAIFGVGHDPDSTVATGNTQLTGSIVLQQGASNSFLQGFYLSGNINFGSSPTDQFVENVVISRVNLASLSISYDGSSSTTSNNIAISECWLRGELYGGYASGLVVSKCFVSQGFRYASNSLFTNNILIGGYCGGGPFSGVDNCLFQNNYISLAFYNCWGNYHISGNSNHFQYNVFNTAPGFPDGSNTGANNWVNIGCSSIFVNCPGASFDYSYDYHLQTPASYIGSDGFEIGIYGTIDPFKEGSVPKNPHVMIKTIAPQTTPTGELNINITVGAQEN